MRRLRQIPLNPCAIAAICIAMRIRRTSPAPTLEPYGFLHFRHHCVSGARNGAYALFVAFSHRPRQRQRLVQAFTALKRSRPSPSITKNATAVEIY